MVMGVRKSLPVIRDHQIDILTAVEKHDPYIELAETALEAFGEAPSYFFVNAFPIRK